VILKRALLVDGKQKTVLTTGKMCLSINALWLTELTFTTQTKILQLKLTKYFL
jgi:hypothetical protein